MPKRLGSLYRAQNRLGEGVSTQENTSMEAQEIIDKLKKKVQKARQIIRHLVDEDECDFDHHGGCQAHGYLSGPCMVKEAKEFLRKR